MNGLGRASARSASIVVRSALLFSIAGCARHYTTTGLILHIDRPGALVTISHDAFPGFMEAMAMPFDLEDGARDIQLTPGDRVRFRLSVKGSRSWVDRLEIVSAARRDAGLQHTPAVATLVPVGSAMPDFELVNQAGLPVTLSALKGKVVAVTFIYTRCPLPDYCPRMVENFRALRDRFADRIGRDLVLLTITFDPRYDSPDVLRKAGIFSPAMHRASRACARHSASSILPTRD